MKCILSEVQLQHDSVNCFLTSFVYSSVPTAVLAHVQSAEEGAHCVGSATQVQETVRADKSCLYQVSTMQPLYLGDTNKRQLGKF